MIWPRLFPLFTNVCIYSSSFVLGEVEDHRRISVSQANLELLISKQSREHFYTTDFQAVLKPEGSDFLMAEHWKLLFNKFYVRFLVWDPTIRL